MNGLLVLATVAQLLANPAPAYSSDMSVETRAAYELLREAPPADLVAALHGLGERGDLSAIEFLGEIYGFGLFEVAIDASRACDFFERAAPHRPDAAHNFATCFYTGRGRPLNLAAAREWYARAAEGGWTTAHCALGNMLVRGEGGERDPANGVALCQLAADRGDRDAQTDLGGYLLTGQGVPRDPVAARGYLERAAGQRQANAAFLMAQIYWKGDGVEKDLAVARRWWEVSYEAGRADAAYWVFQAILAVMIDNSGGEPNIDATRLPEAIAWAEIAAERDPDPTQRAKAADVLPALRRQQAERRPD